jgi:hypothetical protein
MPVHIICWSVMNIVAVSAWSGSLLLLALYACPQVEILLGNSLGILGCSMERSCTVCDCHLLTLYPLFQDFYEDIYYELGKFGGIDNLVVCANMADHMVSLVWLPGCFSLCAGLL